MLRLWWHQSRDAPYQINNLKDDVTSWQKEMFVEAAVWETLQPHVSFETMASEDLQVKEVDEFNQPKENSPQAEGKF